MYLVRGLTVEVVNDTLRAAVDDVNHSSLCVNFLFPFDNEADQQLQTAITFRVLVLTTVSRPFLPDNPGIRNDAL